MKRFDKVDASLCVLAFAMFIFLFIHLLMEYKADVLAEHEAFMDSIKDAKNNVIQCSEPSSDEPNVNLMEVKFAKQRQD